jgi:hypothetical protein
VSGKKIKETLFPGHQGPEPPQHQHLAAQAIVIVKAAKSRRESGSIKN